MISSKIPRVIHVYWGSPTEEMSYLRYMSLMSIKKFCLGWTIKLHIPTHPGGAVTWKTGEQKSFGSLKENYFQPALELADEVVRHDFSDYGFSNGAHEVHKADFLRWQLLSGEGGVWCDLDILFFRSIDEIQFYPGSAAEADTIIHIYPDFKSHAIGFLAGCAHNSLFAECRRQSYDQSLGTYQAIGAELLNTSYITMEKLRAGFPDCSFANITKSSVYHISPLVVDRLYRTGQLVDFPPGSIGCHWFGGHQLSQQFEHIAHGPSAAMPHNTVTQLIENVLNWKKI